MRHHSFLWQLTWGGSQIRFAVLGGWFKNWKNCNISTIYRNRANKGRGFNSKIILLTLHNGAFYKLLSIFNLCYCTKILYNTSTLGIYMGAAIIQERPLLARVRYLQIFMWVGGQNSPKITKVSPKMHYMYFQLVLLRWLISSTGWYLSGRTINTYEGSIFELHSSKFQNQ